MINDKDHTGAVGMTVCEYYDLLPKLALSDEQKKLLSCAIERLMAKPNQFFASCQVRLEDSRHQNVPAPENIKQLEMYHEGTIHGLNVAFKLVTGTLDTTDVLEP